MAYICTTNDYWCSQQIKALTAVQKMGWCLPAICAKILSLIYPFIFLFIHVSQIDSMLFFCFHEVFRPFFRPEGKFDCQVLHFVCGHFFHQKHGK